MLVCTLQGQERIEGRQARQYVNEPLRAQLRTAGLFCLNMDALGIAFMASALSNGSSIMVFPCAVLNSNGFWATQTAWTKVTSINLCRDTPTSIFAFWIESSNVPYIRVPSNDIEMNPVTQENRALHTTGNTEYSLSWPGGNALELNVRTNTGQSINIKPFIFNAWLYCIF